MKVIFFAMPKCAGTFIAKMLFAVKVGYIGHSSLYEARRKIESSIEYGFEVFTFIRDPLMRLASAYNYIIKGGLKNRIDLEMQGILKQYDGFPDVCRNLPEIVENESAVHFFPQYQWIEGYPVHIGRFENLREDYRKFAKKFGFKDFWIDEGAVKKDYSYMYDRETEKIVREFYIKDYSL